MTREIAINVTVLEHGEGLQLPAYETADSAGMDLRAAIAAGDTWTLKPLERVLVPTGLAMALPAGYEAQVRPRSGLAAKKGVTVANAPGTVDADYRGEVKVILINLSNETFSFERGERIAQMVIAPVTQGVWHEVNTLDQTDRGTGGFGSTGTKG